MRVSDFFQLARRQASLDFVDVDIWGDTPLFVDPSVLRRSPTDLANNAVVVLQDFFATVLSAIRAGNHLRASNLLSALREPNETHLGFSKGQARGRALGPKSVQGLVSAFADSASVMSGLLHDLEDSLLLVEGIGPDLISDITINVIRGELIRYTQEQARLHGISLRESVPTGFIWNHEAHEWGDGFDMLPSARGRRLLLVPKWIVRRQVTFTYDTFYSDFVLNYLERSEIDLNTNLVHTLQDGRKRVYKGDLILKYGRRKSVANRAVAEDPTLLQRYKQSRYAFLEQSLHRSDLPTEDSSHLRASLERVKNIHVGNEGAHDYEVAIQDVLGGLFAGDLIMPVPQQEIHDGRKRIDITYANNATAGFFAFVRRHHPAAYVFVECKNYTGDPRNPELDQLAGRFSPQRGRLGFLVCRAIKNKSLFAERCRDTARDDRGFILALDDEDLSQFARWKEKGDQAAIDADLDDRFRFLLS